VTQVEGTSHLTFNEFCEALARAAEMKYHEKDDLSMSAKIKTFVTDILNNMQVFL